jgi:hypothetical protein
MKLFKIIAGILTALAGFSFARKVLDKYDVGIYYVDKEEEKKIIEENAGTPKTSIDLRGTPTHQCVCGSEIWNLQVAFDDYEIATYYLDMECVNCGSIATAPTPIDREVEQ